MRQFPKTLNMTIEIQFEKNKTINVNQKMRGIYKKMQNIKQFKKFITKLSTYHRFLFCSR